MPILCPNCGQVIQLKAAKAGRYTAKCSKCARPFRVVVPNTPGAEPLVSSLTAREQFNDATLATTGPPPRDTNFVVAVDATGEPADVRARPSSGRSIGSGATEVNAPRRANVRPVPTQLGGYRILKELGRGGMGAVYLARQLSLDRNVALKVMSTDFTRDAVLLARFTREAYAAAQLVHHNVVQIYDIGAEQGHNFFSMEFVEGESLGQLLKRTGRFSPEVAAGYILQAARGLHFAHERGMVHRDVKPDNLLLNAQGIVKVADLGLVKLRAVPELAVRPTGALASAGQDITNIHTAVGTPNYMAPEQAGSAATVDARADVYSLGCTFYVLLTGRPLFQGTTAFEVMSKHALEPVIPPEQIVQDVPRELSVLVQKMLAKKPEDRFQTMAAVVAELEEFLHLNRNEFQPRAEHAETLAAAARDFTTIPARGQRRRTFQAVWGFAAVVTAFALLFGTTFRVLELLSFIGLTALAYLVIDGIARRSPLLLKTRDFVLGSSRSDLLSAGASVGLGVLVLLVFNLFWTLLGLTLTAGIIGLGLHLLLDRSLRQQEHEPIERAEALLRSLRLRAVDEDGLRRFVCDYAGRDWEAFYEALFGYEAKLTARARWGSASVRPRHAAWRDPVFAWFEWRLRQRQEAHEQRVLRAVEQNELQARGVASAEARVEAGRRAAALVEQTHTGRVGRPAAPQLDFVSHLQVRRRTLGKRVADVLGWLAPARLRFLLGAFLLAGCLTWAHQNGLLGTMKLGEDNVAVELPAAAPSLSTLAEALPLELPGVPHALTALFDGINPGVAGVVLLLSAFNTNGILGVFVLAAAALMVFGQRLGMPDVGPLSARWLSLTAGLGLAALGVVLGHWRDEV